MSLKPHVSFGFWSQRVWKGLLPNSKKKRKGLLPFGNNISQEKWCWLYPSVSQYTNLILFRGKHHLSSFSHQCEPHICGVYPHVKERERMHTPKTPNTTYLFRALKVLFINKKSFKIENNEKCRTYHISHHIMVLSIILSYIYERSLMQFPLQQWKWS